MMRLSALIITGTLLGAAPALAQQAGHTHGAATGTAQAHGSHGAQAGGAGEGAHCAMHEAKHGDQAQAGHAAMNHDDAVHRYAPKNLLAHAEHLRFTEAQKARLDALQARHHENCSGFMAAARDAEARAAAALERPAPDIAAFEAGMVDAARQKVNCKVDMVRTGQDALAVLTAEQQRQLQHMQHGGHGGH
jgi:Spy/CpxP family protein refolding chaperone